MKHLARVSLAFLILFTLLGLVGCGGGDSRNAFVGRWEGSVVFLTGGREEDEGRLEFTVDEDGQLFGTYERFDTGEISNVDGSLFKGGSFRMNWDFSGYSSPRSCVGQVRKEDGRLIPNTSNGLLTVRNDNGNLGDGLDIRLNFRGN